MKKFSDVPASFDARRPLADVTNAPYLFGDPFGDPDERGDYGDYGDYGDVDPLSPYLLTSGDPETGDLSSWIQSHKRGLEIAGGALGAGALGLGAAALIKKHRQKVAYQNQLNQLKNAQSLNQQKALRTSMGKIDRNHPMPFFNLKGAKMNSSPIDPLSTFVSDMFKQMLDRQAMDTPFYQETASAIYAAGPPATFTATTTGVAQNRFFTGLILQIGTNILNAAPGTVITINMTIPTINGGSLTIGGATPLLLTYEKHFDVRFLMFPWQIVSNKPLPVLGQYNSATPITVTVSGLPAASVVNLVVPGSLHPWTVAMRNALMH